MAVFAKSVVLLSTPKQLNSATYQGFGCGAYDNFNLAYHSGDEKTVVDNNRQLLRQVYQLPSEPKWLSQVHGSRCVIADECQGIIKADASITRQRGVVCAVLTADCLPIFGYDKKGTVVGVCHAGWRGLLAGVVDNFIKKMAISPADIVVYFGAAIGRYSYLVGEEIYQQFCQKNNLYQQAFVKQKQGYYLNLYQLARFILQNLGVVTILGGGQCTMTGDYFSYRRQGVLSGRHAHLIWLKN